MDLLNLTTLSTILAEAAPAAPTASGTATGANPQAEMLKMIVMFACFGAVFYFVLLRPQQKRAREQADMLKSIKSGDKIVTTGGVLGTVITVKDKSVSIRSADSKMEITKSAIAEIVERSGDSSSSSDS
jgi:preprotein translocase subunit YajC